MYTGKVIVIQNKGSHISIKKNKNFLKKNIQRVIQNYERYGMKNVGEEAVNGDSDGDNNCDMKRQKSSRQND